MNLKELRASLPITRHCAYLNIGHASPPTAAVLKRIEETLKVESLIGPASLKGLHLAERIEDDARLTIARFLGADPDDLRITHSTREGVSVVLYGIDWQPGDELLICDLEHSTLSKPGKVLSDRKGINVIQPVISTQAHPKEILNAIKLAINSKTRIVALSHIQYGCGLRMPVKEIARASHERGIPFLIDGAQSVGQISVDVTDLECDFYAFSGQKWLMGPGGTGALYMRRSSRSLLDPLFSTNALELMRDHNRHALSRFAVTSQNPGLVAGFTEAVRIISDIGIKRIEKRVIKLATFLTKYLASISVTILSPSIPSSGLVTIHLDGWPSKELVRVLQTRFNIIARDVHNPEGVRFCTAYFNTEEELERVVKVLKQLREEAHKSF